MMPWLSTLIFVAAQEQHHHKCARYNNELTVELHWKLSEQEGKRFGGSLSRRSER
jgi:hypothetical protein